MNVVVLESIAERGGAQLSLLELVRRLGGEPRVSIVLPEHGPLEADIAAAGATSHVLPWPAALQGLGERSGLALAKAARAAVTLPTLVRDLGTGIAALAPDVVITNGIKPHVLGALASLPREIPLVWYLRDGFEGRPVSSRLMRLLARRASAAIAISKYVASDAARVLPRTPIEQLYDVVELDGYDGSAPAPEDLPKPVGEVWFAVIGALAPLKGQDVFLRAAARVAAQVPGARFLLVGSNLYRTQAASTYESELRALADVPALAGRVRFLGQRGDVPRLLRVVDVLVQPNRGPEGLGRTVIEAMASGLAVLAVDRWGPAELVDDGRTGLLTPVIDVDALAAKMVKLALDAALRARLGTEAARSIRQILSPDRSVAAFRSLLARLT